MLRAVCKGKHDQRPLIAGSTINDHLSLVAGVLPGRAFDIEKDQVDRVLAKGDVKLGLAFVFSFLLTVWSANGGMKAIIDALNVVYEESEKRGFLKLNAISLAFTFGGLVAALLAIGGVVALPIILTTIGLGSISDTLLRIGRWPVLILMMLLGLAVLYRFGPSRRAPQWRWLSVGSVFATATWLAGSGYLVPLSSKLCELRRHLRIAGRRDRPNGVDVDVYHRRSAWGRT
jgi:membrane protein